MPYFYSFKFYTVPSSTSTQCLHGCGLSRFCSRLVLGIVVSSHGERLLDIPLLAPAEPDLPTAGLRSTAAHDMSQGSLGLQTTTPMESASPLPPPSPTPTEGPVLEVIHGRARNQPRYKFRCHANAKHCLFLGN
jgi:hypothetical protein